MVNNKTEIENQDHDNLEKLIDELKNQNSTLKKKIFELELEVSQLKSNKTLEIKNGKGVKKISKFVKKIKKKGEAKLEEPLTDSPIEEVKALLRNDHPPKLASKSIFEGSSRRECPICSNTNKSQIFEIMDKTNIILDYPRIYGKKFKCGSCGNFWKLPHTLE